VILEILELRASWATLDLRASWATLDLRASWATLAILERLETQVLRA
jgi:hypothetical protein